MGTAALARDEADPAEVLLRRALALAAPSTGRRCPRTSWRWRTCGTRRRWRRLRRLAEAEDEVRPVLDGCDRAGCGRRPGGARRGARKRGETDAARAALVSALSTASEAGADRLTAEALRELGCSTTSTDG
jgi:hypothetical protein